MEKMRQQLADHDRRITTLEKYREHDIQLINENNKNLAVIVVELKNIAETMKTLTNNWREAIERSNARQREEHEQINNKINLLEKNVSSLNSKQENDKEKIENTIDERTILKDSNNYQKYVYEIIKYIIIAILGYVVALVLK